MTRRLLIVWDQAEEENGFIILDATNPLARSHSWDEIKAAKERLEEQGK